MTISKDIKHMSKEDLKPMEHRHMPILQLNNTISCRTCGEQLTDVTTELCKLSSATRARQVVEEIATVGKYTAVAIVNGFVVYCRNLNNNIREEVTAERISSRSFRVNKRLLTKEVD